MAKQNGTRVMTNAVRLTYAHIFEPHANEGSDKLMYSTCLLINKDDQETIDAINAAIEEALKSSNAFNGRMPARSTLRMPLRDGDEERPDNEAFKNCYFLNAKSKFQPVVYDQKLNTITDPNEMYSGVWANVILSFYAYNFNGNKGVGCSLGNIQKVRDGDRLGGSQGNDFGFGEIGGGGNAKPAAKSDNNDLPF